MGTIVGKNLCGLKLVEEEKQTMSKSRAPCVEDGFGIHSLDLLALTIT